MDALICVADADRIAQLFNHEPAPLGPSLEWVNDVEQRSQVHVRTTADGGADLFSTDEHRKATPGVDVGAAELSRQAPIPNRAGAPR